MFKKLFSILCYLIMALVVGTMLFRIYTLNHYPAFAKGVIHTPSLSVSYNNSTLNGVTWEPETVFDDTGDFFIHQPIYFENEKTLILTVRYNNSLLEELRHDGSGEDLKLDVSLYADGKTRVHPTTYSYGEAYGIYSYRRYVFENVVLDDYDILYADIYTDIADYTVSPYSSISVYDGSEKIKPYRLTGADKRALK